MEYFSQKDAIIDFLKDQQRRGAIIPDETFKQIERDYGYDGNKLERDSREI